MKKKNLFALLLCSILVFTSTIKSSALSYTTYRMPNGGSWTYSGRTDTSITKNWSQTKWRSVVVVQKVEFISPSTVQKVTNDLAKKVGIEKSRAAVKYGIDAAATHGVTKAKDMIVKKFGSKIAGKVIPYINAIGWIKTACDILDDIALGDKLKMYSNAATKKKGIVYVKARQGSGSATKHYYWDSSSPYGSYPYAQVGPNKWQKGSTKIK